ncbi:MAG: peptidoglycan recognition family protein [Patescibacteria group bacterium]|nr:peptidoglycan recognition family protein [Patescibacteria group bacterium]
MKRFLDWLLAATAVGCVLFLGYMFRGRLQHEAGRYALLQNAHAEQAQTLSEREEEISKLHVRLTRTQENFDLMSDQANQMFHRLLAMNKQTAALEREIIRLQPLREVDRIVVHHTASEHGDVSDIDRWHRERGFDSIGYHYVITNGVSHSGEPCLDGEIQIGRPEDVVGAHARGRNACSIGVSMVGGDSFTKPQVESLTVLLAHLCRRHGIAADKIAWAVEPHHTNCPGTGCPLKAIKAKVTELVRGLNDREH